MGILVGSLDDLTVSTNRPRRERMNDDTKETKLEYPEFDFSHYPLDSLFHERRNGQERRGVTKPKAKRTGQGNDPTSERRAKKERRRRVDPTTFEKQYTDDELEFMNAMQRYKELSGKTFPSHAEVIKVAVALGYRKILPEDDAPWETSHPDVSPALGTHCIELRACSDIVSRSTD
jgi:hypothetical protein